MTNSFFSGLLTPTPSCSRRRIASVQCPGPCPVAGRRSIVGAGMSGQPAATELRGRGEERGALDRLLDGARAGQSSVLVIRGEPGIGKSALLEYTAERASGFRIARARGVESEMEFAFAGLQQLCGGTPRERAEQLAAPQRDALLRAYGVMGGPPPEAFLVGLAVLNLLSNLAEE